MPKHAVGWLKAHTLPDGEYVSDDERDSLILEEPQSAEAAVARATTLLQGAFDGTDHEASKWRCRPLGGTAHRRAGSPGVTPPDR